MITDKQDAIEYIESVLSGWGSWQTHHEKLVQAMQVLVNSVKESDNKTSEVAAEIIADIEKILEVDENGEAKFDIRELFKIEKKYTEGGE